MSTYLLRPDFKRALYSSCLRFPNRRFCSSVALVSRLEPSTSRAYRKETYLATKPTSSRYLSQEYKDFDPPTSSKNEKAEKNRGPDVNAKPPNRNDHMKVSLSRRSPLDPTKVEEHLAFVKATKSSVTLADIERCQPRTHGSPGSQQYEADYNALLDTLVRSFSTKQLRTFVKLYNLKPRLTSSRRTKRDYAVSIMEQQWNWPSLSQIQKDQRDRTEMVEKIFTLNPCQLFFILGKDGADLLSLSAQYDIHISFSSDPFSVRVEGVRGQIDKLSDHIEDLKNEVQEEIFELPGKGLIRNDRLQWISRLAGAFTENFGKGIVRISFKSTEPHTLLVAKQLVTRAACEEFTGSPILSYIPSAVPSTTPAAVSMSSEAYSLYPFLSPRSSTWSINTSGSFRIRRVTEWLGAKTTEDVPEMGALSEGGGHILLMGEKPGDLKDVLLANFVEPAPGLIGSSRVVTASFGHILWTPPLTHQRAIVPPLRGTWQISKILQWMHNHALKPVFVSSMPTAFFDSPSTQQRVLHRLVYHSIPALSTVTLDHDQAPLPPTKVIKFEIMLTSPQHPTPAARDSMNESTPASNTFSNLAAESLDGRFASRCWFGTETIVDLMVPDRLTDIQFSASNAMTMPIGQWPTELQTYLSDLQLFLSHKGDGAIQPDVPLTLTHQDLNFVLLSNSRVRQSVDHVLIPHARSNDRTPIQTVTESILDLDGNQKSVACQVTCDDLASEACWRSFLRNCDELIGIHYRPPSSSVFNVRTNDVDHWPHSSFEDGKS